MAMQMTERSASSDVELLSLLDFEVACEIRKTKVWLGLAVKQDHVACARAARWIIRCIWCGRVALACDEHLQWVLSVERMLCTECGSVGAPRALLRWMPLDGAR